MLHPSRKLLTGLDTLFATAVVLESLADEVVLEYLDSFDLNRTIFKSVSGTFKQNLNALAASHHLPTHRWLAQ